MKKGFEHEKPCSDHLGNNYPAIKEVLCVSTGV